MSIAIVLRALLLLLEPEESDAGVIPPPIMNEKATCDRPAKAKAKGWP